MCSSIYLREKCKKPPNINFLVDRLFTLLIILEVGEGGGFSWGRVEGWGEKANNCKWITITIIIIIIIIIVVVAEEIYNFSKW